MFSDLPITARIRNDKKYAFTECIIEECTVYVHVFYNCSFIMDPLTLNKINCPFSLWNVKTLEYHAE